MNIKTKTSLVGFLLALANLNSPSTAKTIGEISQTTTKPSLEQRLNLLNGAIREREEQLTESSQSQNNFTRSRSRGWADGRYGSWSDVNSWHNGWSDRG